MGGDELMVGDITRIMGPAQAQPHGGRMERMGGELTVCSSS